MNVLLDTHIFLWFISGDPRLPDFMRENIQNPDHDVYLSVVSLWEVIVKYQLGKLALPYPPESYLPEQRAKHHIASLTLHETAVARLVTLPSIHRDPFDRMIICQALEHDLTLITVDSVMGRYPVKILRAS